MSLTLLGWLLIGSSIALSALLIFQLRSSNWQFGQVLRGRTGTWIVVAAAFLLVAGIGAGASYIGTLSGTAGSEDTASYPGSDEEILARLTNYSNSIGTEGHASAAPGKMLPDVNTMIERLAARLETAPDDVQGWQMLGWSYFNTGAYDQAANAYAKAVALNPSSAELKLLYEKAKAKTSDTGSSETTASMPTETVGKGGDPQGTEKTASFEAVPPHENDAAIRSMVDGLADRLENSPRDVEGWTRLIRSRVVLGEREVAAAAFRKALEVFQDDSAASAKITATAIELGLTSE